MYGHGGFLPLSPPASSLASTTSSSALPDPRASPLRSGSSKESTFIRYVDQQILRIQRRFAKRDNASRAAVQQDDEQGRSVAVDGETHHTPSERWNDVPGYSSFAEAARDVEELLGVIWVSGTPSLQIPYLISLALLVNTLIPSFPASPRQLFRVIAKLDHAFSSLMVGRDIETDQVLPGFDRGKKVSTTEKVRIKSLVERTRISTARLMTEGNFASDDEEEDDLADSEGDLILDDDSPDALVTNATDWNMEVAKVYDKTLQKLGDTMDGPTIGIQTEPHR